ncbi:30 kDa heat shock protein [Paramyrothecium foliicola]|nr:30 kDa heat shock protein [Paramyrothecium foliicola]
MAFFFPRTVYHTPATTLNPFFRLLSELDQQLQQPQPTPQPHVRRTEPRCPAYRVSVRPWEPHFEAQETDDAFVIYGELPGLNKDHVTVEFPEPRKLVVSGNVERQSTPPTKPVEPLAQEPSVGIEAISEDTQSRSSYQATVEDDEEGDDFEVLSQSSKTSPEGQPAQSQQPSVEQADQKQPAETPNAPSSYTKKEFSRYFTFPTHVNHEAVTADLKDGLLTVVVPKAKKPEPHRVFVH